MKEKIKVFAQKCFCWGCMVIGMLGTLALGSLGVFCFVEENIANAAFSMFLPFVGSCQILWAVREKFSSKMELYVGKTVGQKEFWLFGCKLLLQTAGIVVLAIIGYALTIVVVSVACLAIFSLAKLLVSWLIQNEILSVTHEIAIIVAVTVSIALVIIYAFSKIFSD